MSRNLRIVLIHPPHESEARAQALHAGLAEAGYDLVASLPADFHLPEHIARLQPDMIIVDAESDARDVLEHIVIATRDERRPIVMFTEDDKADSMEAAMAAGVSAYVVAGLQAERIKPVLDELEGTRLKLAERKLIDRAKGILMARQGLTEDQAFQKLRTMAMNKNLKLADLAQRILDAEDLLG
jgi:response regulator NasT